MKRPLIGITSIKNEEKRAVYRTNAPYIDSIFRAGGLPIQLPAVDLGLCDQIVRELDGLLIPGGPDISPFLYGQEAEKKTVFFRRDADLFEIELVRLARERRIPVLGICRGIQLINVAFGGDLYQDLPTDFPTKQSHYQSAEIRDEPSHLVYLQPDSRLARIFGGEELEVNSFHHQAVKNLAAGFLPVGKASDGLIEAIESEDGLIIGVQWHPEEMAPLCRKQAKLFEDFVSRCMQVKAPLSL